MMHVDPNAAHAVYAPSSAHRWAEEGGCSASAEAIAALGEQEEGEEAAEGTAAHEELERVLNGGVPDHDHPAAYGVALFAHFVKQLPAGRTWIEQRVRLTGQIWGRLDFGHWHEESQTVTIVDEKNGFVGVDAELNDQLRIYGASLILSHSLPAKWIRYVIVQPNDFRPVPRVKQWIESAEDLHKYAARVAAIPDGPKQFVAGPQCTYCPLFGRCEASRDMLQNLVPLIAGLMTADQVPPAQRALFLACEKPIKDAFKNATAAWEKDALKNGPPPGMMLVTAQKHRAWKDENAARVKIFAARGIDAFDPPTPAAAEKLGVDIESLVDKPPDGPVLAFANDKRKPWAPPTAAQMFAGVARLVGPK